MHADSLYAFHKKAVFNPHNVKLQTTAIKPRDRQDVFITCFLYSFHFLMYAPIAQMKELKFLFMDVVSCLIIIISWAITRLFVKVTQLFHVCVSLIFCKYVPTCIYCYFFCVSLCVKKSTAEIRFRLGRQILVQSFSMWRRLSIRLSMTAWSTRFPNSEC